MNTLHLLAIFTACFLLSMKATHHWLVTRPRNKAWGKVPRGSKWKSKRGEYPNPVWVVVGSCDWPEKVVAMSIDGSGRALVCGPDWVVQEFERIE